MKGVENYLEFKVKPILDEVVYKTVCQRPENPIRSMIGFLREIEIKEQDNFSREIKKRELKEREMMKKENHEFRWYFKGNKELEEGFWIPYRIEESILIETNYFKYETSEGPQIFQGKFFSIDFKDMIETRNGNSTTIGRFKECPENVERKNYFTNSLSAIIVSSKNQGTNNLSKHFSFMFKNIFPSKFYPKLQNLQFYFKSEKNPLILHLSSGWSTSSEPEISNPESTRRIVAELRNKGYSVICEIETDGKETNFKNLGKIPKSIINSIFETNWYHKYIESNMFVWEQFRKDLKEDIEEIYNDEYLNKGNNNDIPLNKHENYFINFNTNRLKKENNESSIMRFHFNNTLPDEIKTVIVSETIYNEIRLKIESQKKENNLVFNSAQLSPTTFNSLIDEIKKEIYKQGVKLDSLDGVEAYNKLYLNRIVNTNFVSTIIRMFIDEGFLNRRMNKILRDNDYEQLWEIKYFYFSMLYCLNEITSKPDFHHLYRGLNLRSEQEKQYKSLTNGNIITFNEFLSTTYSKENAITYSSNKQGSVLLEINIPAEFKIPKVDNFSIFEKEREVMFPPGTNFLVKDVVEEEQITVIKLTLF